MVRLSRLVPSLLGLLLPAAMYAADAPAAQDGQASHEGAAAETTAPAGNDMALDAPAGEAPGTVGDAPPPQFVPTPTSPPTPVRSHLRLIDDSIPAFSQVHYVAYRKDSRAETLYSEIRAFLASVEGRVMAGTLHRPSMTFEAPKDDEGNELPDVNPVAVPREQLAEEEQIGEFLGKLTALHGQLRFPNHFEHWHLDNSWRDLARASELLRLGLTDAAFTNLDDLHVAWTDHYHSKLRQAQAEYALELLNDPESGVTSASSALQAAKTTIVKVPYPKMSLVKEYPPVAIPQVLPPSPRPVAAPAQKDMAPEPAPAAKAKPKSMDMAPSKAYGDALFDAGKVLYQQGIEIGNNEQRDQLLNQAEWVLAEAVTVYDTLVKGGDDSLIDVLTEANKIKYATIKSARTSGKNNKSAKTKAMAVIEEVKQSLGATAPEPMPEKAPEPAPVEEKPVEQPAPVEEKPAEPAPVEEKPAEKPAEPEPVVEDPPPAEEKPAEPVAEPPAEKPAEEKPAAKEEPKTDKGAEEALEDFALPE